MLEGFNDYAYDEDRALFYPKEYKSYQDFKDQFLKKEYVNTILTNRLDLLLEYYHSTTRKYTIEDKLDFNHIELLHQASTEVLKSIICGEITINELIIPISMNYPGDNRKLIFSNRRNLKLQIISIVDLLKQRTGLYAPVTEEEKQIIFADYDKLIADVLQES